MRAVFVAVLVLGGWLGSLPSAAQIVPPPTQANPVSSNQAPTPASTASEHKGIVLFSRSAESAQKDASNSEAAVAIPSPQTPAEVKTQAAQNIERAAITVTALDLDVHLRTADQGFAVRARLTVRNDGSTPLQNILLQISSTLHWDQIRLADGLANIQRTKSIPFTQAKIKSDVDHTGQLTEANLALAQPLVPGATLALDVSYAGILPQSADRLVAIGTPDEAARLSDWDRITPAFTGLRGFGNVVWYPVASTPVFLGEGSKFFDEIGAHRLRFAAAPISIHLTVEFQPGNTPTIALINGHPASLTVTNANSDAEVAGIATTSAENAVLGFDEPSLFIAVRTEHKGTNLNVWSRTEDETNIAPWTIAASDVSAFLEGWLGKPHSDLTLLDLPEAEDAPFESGALLATPINSEGPAQLDALDGILAHALTHSFSSILPAQSASPQPLWLNEGLAQFISTLWIEKQHGRNQALRVLEASRMALALAEPESPGAGDGQPLNTATSTVYYRTKAAYIFWMLRDQVGEGNLKTALHSYNAVSRTAPDTFEQIVEKNSPLPNNTRNFFAEWVNTDKGLPDLAIDSVFFNAASTPGSWLVAVNVANAGYVAAEVPITVRSQSNTATERVLVPARGKATRRILVVGQPLEAQVNDGTVPETQATIHIRKLK